MATVCCVVVVVRATFNNCRILTSFCRLTLNKGGAHLTTWMVGTRISQVAVYAAQLAVQLPSTWSPYQLIMRAQQGPGCPELKKHRCLPGLSEAMVCPICNLTAYCCPLT